MIQLPDYKEFLAAKQRHIAISGFEVDEKDINLDIENLFSQVK